MTQEATKSTPKLVHIAQVIREESLPVPDREGVRADVNWKNIARSLIGHNIPFTRQEMESVAGQVIYAAASGELQLDGLGRDILRQATRLNPEAAADVLASLSR